MQTAAAREAGVELGPQPGLPGIKKKKKHVIATLPCCLKMLLNLGKWHLQEMATLAAVAPRQEMEIYVGYEFYIVNRPAPTHVLPGDNSS
jgi:hypothetical protein